MNANRHPRGVTRRHAAPREHARRLLRAVRAAVCMAAGVALSGCIELSQRITMDPTGRIEVYFEATVSRANVDLVNSMSDSGETVSVDSFVDLQDANDDATVKSLGGRVVRIDDGINVGIGVDLLMDMSSPDTIRLMNEHDSPMVPDISEEAITIFFQGEAMDPEDYEAASWLFTAYKYRLTIGKDVLGPAPRVEFLSKRVDFTPVLEERIDTYYLEIPVLYVLSNPDGCALVIHR